MNQTELERDDELVTALQYDSYGTKSLTDFDRMFIHKERSAIINGYGHRDKVPEDVEQKIKRILHLVKQMNWIKPNI